MKVGKVEVEVTTSDPTKEQIGGDHYKSLAIQPAEYIQKNNLGFFEGCVLKYITRHAYKGGREDIEKAIHFLRMLIRWTYQTPAEAEEEKESSMRTPHKNREEDIPKDMGYIRGLVVSLEEDMTSIEEDLEQLHAFTERLDRTLQRIDEDILNHNTRLQQQGRDLARQGREICGHTQRIGKLDTEVNTLGAEGVLNDIAVLHDRLKVLENVHFSTIAAAAQKRHLDSQAEALQKCPHCGDGI